MQKNLFGDEKQRYTLHKRHKNWIVIGLSSIFILGGSLMTAQHIQTVNAESGADTLTQTGDSDANGHTVQLKSEPTTVSTNQVKTQKAAPNQILAQPKAALATQSVVTPAAQDAAVQPTVSFVDNTFPDGQDNGPTAWHLIYVNADFGSDITDAKTVTVNIPRGLMVQAIPTNTPKAGTAQVQADPKALGPLLQSVQDGTTVVPNSKNSWYGQIVFQIKPGVSKVQIPLQVSTNLDEFYGQTSSLPVTASATNGTQTANPVQWLIKSSISNEQNLSFYSGGLGKTLQIDANSPDPVAAGQDLTMKGSFDLTNRPNGVFFTHNDFKITVPEGITLTFDSAKLLADNNYSDTSSYRFTQVAPNQFELSADNRASGFMAIQLLKYLSYSAYETAPGTYQLPANTPAIIFTGTTYDGKTVTVSSKIPDYNTKFVVVNDRDNIATFTKNTSSTPNNLDGLTTDYFQYIGNGELSNPKSWGLTNQQLEIAIGTGLQTRQVNLPVVTGVTYGPVTVTTTTGRVVTLDSLDQPLVDLTTIGAQPGEYISSVSAFLPSLPANYNVYQTSSANTNNGVGIWAKFAAGADPKTATINETVKALNPDGTAAAGSVSQLIWTYTSKPVSPDQRLTSLKVTGKGDTYITAGTDLNYSVTVTGAGSVNAANNLGVTSMDFYVKGIPGVPLSGLSFSLTSSTYTNQQIAGGTSIGTPYVASDGNTYVKIHVDLPVGQSFSGNNYDMTLNISGPTSSSAVISEPWSDYVFVASKNTAFTGGMTYTGDPDNTGVSSTISIAAPANKLTIIPKENVNVDTYFTKAGSDVREPAYDTANPDSAFGVTKAGQIDYHIKISNDRTDSANKLQVYIPIPKKGMDFGENLQSKAFAWNMALNGALELKIYDKAGNDITASQSQNHQIQISTDASNADNYQGATYLNLSDASSTDIFNATMLRIVNITGIPSGNRVEIVLPYKYQAVDNQTDETGAINDFTPYYYFEAGNAVWQSSDRVGLRLADGVVSGQYFLDADGDGKYTASSQDTLLSGRTLELQQLQADGTFKTVATTTTLSGGYYSFAELDIGTYQVVAGPLEENEHFTLQNRSPEAPLDGSAVDPTTGIITNIDPTKLAAGSLSIGVVKYTLNALINGQATADITVPVGQSADFITSATPDYILNPGWGTDSLDLDVAGIASVDRTTGRVTGLAAGDVVYTYTVSDGHGGVANAQATVHVVKPTVTVTLNGGTKIYDGKIIPNNFQLTLTTADKKVVTVALTDTDYTITNAVGVVGNASDVGTYRIQLTADKSEQLANLYDLTNTVPISSVYTITPATSALSLSGNDGKIFDGTAGQLTPTKYVVSLGDTGLSYQLQDGDVVFASANPINVGEYDVQLSAGGLANIQKLTANYVFSTPTSSAKYEITAASTVVGLSGSDSKAYDGNAGSINLDKYSVTLSNGDQYQLVAGDLAFVQDNPTSVGHYDVTLTEAGLNHIKAQEGNYSVTYDASVGSYDITAAAIVVGLSGSDSKAYDGKAGNINLDKYSVTLSNGDQYQLVAGDLAFVQDNPTSVGHYDVTLTEAGLNHIKAQEGNYSVTYDASVGSYDITAAAIVVGLSGSDSKAYDGKAGNINLDKYSVTLSNGDQYQLVAGDLAFVQDNPTSVGHYDVTLTEAGLNHIKAQEGNYSVTYDASVGSYDITAAAIVVGLSGSDSKAYDGKAGNINLDKYSVTLSNGDQYQLVAGDLAFVQDNPTSVGHYDVTLTEAGLNHIKAQEGNYTVTYDASVGSYGITAASTVVGLSGTDSKAYDGNAGSINLDKYSVTLSNGDQYQLVAGDLAFVQDNPTSVGHYDVTLTEAGLNHIKSQEGNYTVTYDASVGSYDITATPTQPGEPTEPGQPTTPEKPTEPEKPTQPGKPTIPEHPTQPANPGMPDAHGTGSNESGSGSPVVHAAATSGSDDDLPQTGDDANAWLSLLGTIWIGFLGLLGANKRREGR
ncbi:MBG domain-containing protein [Lacticaseibacillus brantae]|uniref:LPXTG-motif cell wall anchor domain protein n=1 Tax=Lacticaseibacillus brantae DSM 23927 TaxID=1423727 RepID=A0A0R2AYH5_9LACO|nr:MBG domain-containing protein [Lacticaseibacillus brantae]KRM71983.1 LPXTG-motif cell wall anchor domain protein [Lacticaseibacillus brantae DSM 23927]